nr:membrane protein insertase YidC [uncultured Sphaerochaeta sp.]
MYNIIVSPIELLVELLFVFFFKAFDNIGFSIAAISLLVSLLSLPLYHIADQLQRKERDMRVDMQPGIQRIKTAFKGDEQYMILSTFYRQNHYHPSYTLRSSVSLLIQVPFFIAAYHFLSNLPHLQGESFLFIQDLGQPDQLFRFGAFNVNVLPIVMTIINIIAGAIYTKGFPKRDKIQLYSMAGLFLLLLYQSPAGLVYYWTLNNIFSLVKNLFYKLKNPLILLYFLSVLSCISLTAVILITKSNLPLSKQIVLVVGCVLISIIPLPLKLIKKLQKEYLTELAKSKIDCFKLFLLSSLFLWLLCGVVIPSNLIFSSPIEFAYTGIVENPLEYIFHTLTFFLGLVVIWPLFIYGMARKQARALLAYSFIIISLSALTNVFLFKGSYGMVSNQLLFDNPSLLLPSIGMVVIPIIVFISLAVLVLVFIQKNWIKFISIVLTVLVATSSIIGLYSSWNINDVYNNHMQNLEKNQQGTLALHEIKPSISLSKEGDNVFILFLDRAISSYLPLVFEEFPFLEQQFKGFTYYPNTISFGAWTLTGAPPLMGGYEYTPDEMNLRDNEKLVSKHNEATLVLPKLFSDAGYSVSVFDPPFANYQWSDDYTAFRPYPEIKVNRMIGKYSLQYKSEHEDALNWDESFESTNIQNKLPMYSLFKIVFPVLRSMIYDQGTYFLMDENPQVTDAFIDSYAVLHYLPEITATDNHANSFVFLTNDTTHEPTFLQAPYYIPKSIITDSSNPLEEDDAYNQIDQIHYQANAAALIKIGIWLDYLKSENIYDNTRIIIVSDHGRDVTTPTFKDYIYDGNVHAFYNPLLLVKDFNENNSFHTDMCFMTNADVPTIAINNLDVSSKNPFTRNDLYESVNKELVNVYYSSADPRHNQGNVFDLDLNKSFSIHDSIFEESNWTPLGQE